jgi:hypothetical protein
VLEYVDAARPHAVHDELTQIGVHAGRPTAGEQRAAADDDGRPADGAEEAAVLDGNLGSTDDDDPPRFVVEVFDERGVVEDARESLALDARARGARSGGQYEGVGRVSAPRGTHRSGVEHLGFGVDDELDAELVGALPVHVRVRPAALGAEQLDQFEDRRGRRVERREPEPSLQRLPLIELTGRFAEQVVWHAGLVGAGTAQEGPSFQHQRPAAEAAQDGCAEPTRAPATDEDRVEVPAA